MQHHQIPSLDDLPDTALIRQAQLLKWIPISASSLWRRVSSDSYFPKPHKLSKGVTVWKVGDIRAYIAKACDDKRSADGSSPKKHLQPNANNSKEKLV